MVARGEPVIKVRDVVVDFYGRRVLNGVDLDLKRGRQMAAPLNDLIDDLDHTRMRMAKRQVAVGKLPVDIFVAVHVGDVSALAVAHIGREGLVVQRSARAGTDTFRQHLDSALKERPGLIRFHAVISFYQTRLL